MYVVTFYSYKGGVGRTMALVNTGVALARAGRRVLMVDFDLEAPGLPSYSVFEAANCGAGLVDYVTAYRTTGIAPKVSEYIAPCDVEGARLWLMPAGRHTQPGYTEALNSIDWQDLYDHQEGYLMFEDMKQQWARYDGKGFDYVLIDSRTGHTDVGGICTRQLPDAVVIMFLPNEQNIEGLAPIVEAIKAEKSRRKPIALEFCPSNVPDLDDEKEILSALLSKAKAKLKYRSEPAAILHHYSSLEILSQSAFVLSRPNSRLSKEYEKLRASIVALNFDDAEGARVVLERLPSQFEQARSQSRTKVLEDVRATAIDIRSRHPQDGEIAYLAARVFSEIGDAGEEIEALTAAIELGYELNRSRLARAFTYSSVNRRDDMLRDLDEIIRSPTATIFELVPTLQILQELDHDWIGALRIALDRPDSEFTEVKMIANFAQSRREALEAIANRFERSLSSATLSRDNINAARNITVLAMIGSGQFARAQQALASLGDPASFSLIDSFNYSIARWGERGMPSSEDFARLLDLFGRAAPDPSTNFHQCHALVAAVAGQIELAGAALEAAIGYVSPANEFSCWRYLYVDGEAMLDDLAAMRERLEAGLPLVPAVLTEFAASPN